MPLAPSVLYRGQPGTSSTTLYTVTNTAGKYAIIKHITITNVTALPVYINLANVPSGGTESDANRFMKNTVVPAEGFIYVDLSMILGQNESLRATAGTASAITILVSGVTN